VWSAVAHSASVRVLRRGWGGGGAGDEQGSSFVNQNEGFWWWKGGDMVWMSGHTCEEQSCNRHLGSMRLPSPNTHDGCLSMLLLAAAATPGVDWTALVSEGTRSRS
jgi:hypothetical protein